MKLRGRKNQCPSCLEGFASLYAFEKHRQGEYGVNRHCILPGEMSSLDWKRDHKGFWMTPGRVDLPPNDLESLESTRTNLTEV